VLIHAYRTWVGETENLGDITRVNEVFGGNGWRHSDRGYPSRRIRPILVLVGAYKLIDGPGGAPTPRGPAETREGGPDMQHHTPLQLDQLAGRATITIEQTAQLLGLGRTAAYDAARRGELPTRRLGRRLLVPVPALLAWLEAN